MVFLQLLSELPVGLLVGVVFRLWRRRFALGILLLLLMIV